MAWVLPAVAKALKDHSHRRVIAKDIDDKEWAKGGNTRRWPVGSSWVCILQTVYEKDHKAK
jgi:hypothetical protein